MPVGMVSDVLIAPGVHDDGRALTLLSRVAEGFTIPEAEAQLLVVGLKPEQLAILIGRDTRTLKTKAARGARLDRRDTAELVEIVRLYQYALEVLGNLKHVHEWFGDAHPSLGDQAPSEVARDAYGRSLVRDILGRIEHGVFG